jgi:hypothetical protein
MGRYALFTKTPHNEEKIHECDSLLHCYDIAKAKKEAMIPLKINRIGVKQYPIKFIIKNTENNLVIREL